MGEILPNNWVETGLFNISDVITGKKDANHADDSGKYTFFTCAAQPLKSADFDYDGEVLILPGNGANVGMVFYYNGKFQAYQRTYIVQNIKINSKFLYYHFLLHWEKRNENEQFGTATNYIKIGNFEVYKVDIAPLPEQERIANKLDALFSQLEGIRAAMERIPTLLKNFRQQVLNQAVTGKLTEEWREGKKLEDWRDYKLIELVLAKPKNGFSPQSVDYPTDVKSLSLSATTSGKFNSKYIKYLDIKKPDKSSHLWLKKGDILIQRSNSLEYVGTAAIFDGEDFEYIYPDIMMKVQVNDKVINQYLYYSLSSSYTKKYFRENASGTAGNMPKINQNTVCNTPINLPPLPEQQEIVRRVESLFLQADVIEQQYQSLKQKIDNLPQAILHKAFKGELVEQLPTDGDARDLLCQIEELKGASKKKK